MADQSQRIYSSVRGVEVDKRSRTGASPELVESGIIVQEEGDRTVPFDFLTVPDGGKAVGKTRIIVDGGVGQTIGPFLSNIPCSHSYIINLLLCRQVTHTLGARLSGLPEVVVEVASNGVHY